MVTTSRGRTVFIAICLALWGFIVVGRLIYVQIVKHDDYVSRAADQQERTLSLTPVRGSIQDGRGRILAESIAVESIYADPKSISNRREIAKKLAGVRELGLSQKEIEKRLTGDRGFAWIARQVDEKTIARVRAMDLNGIYFLPEHRRAYPKAALAANLIGYVDVDGKGLAGIERSWDRYARGRAGKVTLLRDARRGMYLVGGQGANAPEDGLHIVLTIDEVVQFIAERALANAVERYRAAGGSVVVLDARDNAILAIASSPSFDPNKFRDFGPETWRNRAVQDLYEPGSTFKIVTAAAALEEGIVTASDVIDCGDGKIEIGRTSIREHDSKQYGLMSFEDVIANSSNVGTIKVALRLGERRFYDYIRNFGFGERTGVELPAEGVGIVRPPEKWSMLSNAVMSIGQEVAVTPLQLAQAYAVIASGGVRRTPRIVSHVSDSSGRTVWQPPVAASKRVVSERTAAVMNEILKSVVVNGTGTTAALPDHVVAGKTGTAQKAAKGGYSLDKYVASFAGYVPADRPRLVIVAVVDEPHGSHYGGVVAAPVFREVAEATLRYLDVSPSLPTRQVGAPPVRLATFSQSIGPGISKASDRRVPELRGLDGRTAVAAATAAGFRVAVRGQGVVRSQKPLAGAIAKRNTVEIIMGAPEETK